MPPSRETNDVDIEIGDPIPHDIEDEIEIPSDEELTDFSEYRKQRDKTGSNRATKNKTYTNNTKIVYKKINRLDKNTNKISKLLLILIILNIFFALWIIALSIRVLDIDQKLDYQKIILDGINKPNKPVMAQNDLQIGGVLLDGNEIAENIRLITDTNQTMNNTSIATIDNI